MNRILFGDNQFFGINHISEEKSRNQSIQFKEDKTIVKTIKYANNMGIDTFMCTTHDRMINITSIIKNNPIEYEYFNFYPCMPYAHKYANAVTELGIIGALKQYVPGNYFSTLFKTGTAYLKKDYISMMHVLIDAEMKIFEGTRTPIVFLQNVITDMLLGLGMKDLLKAFHDYITQKYNAEAGFITMNMPRLINDLESIGIYNPVICTSINKIGFRMAGGIELYEKTLQKNSARIIAMQVFAGGAIPPNEALKYICQLPNVESILFGASSKQNIEQTVNYIHQFDSMYQLSESQIY